MQGHDEISSLFASLAPSANYNKQHILVPHHITASRDWSLSCVARVITDRTVFDDNFINHMIRIWNVHPATRIAPIAKHTYLVDFVNPREMYDVLHREPWSYRTDFVSMRKINEPSQLKPEHVSHVGIWTQFHDLPPEMLSADGVLYLAPQIGSPLLEVKQGYSGGRLFMCVKISFPAAKSLLGRITLDHPTLGATPIYLVYERAARLCSYCGTIGHEIAGCSKRGRVLALCDDPNYFNRPELPFLRDHRMGPWMNCASLVPRPETTLQADEVNAPPGAGSPNHPLQDPNPINASPYVPPHVPPMNFNPLHHNAESS